MAAKEANARDAAAAPSASPGGERTLTSSLNPEPGIKPQAKLEAKERRMRAQLSNAVLARFACICAAVQSHSNDNKARRCKGLGVTWALGLGCCFGCTVLFSRQEVQ